MVPSYYYALEISEKVCAPMSFLYPAGIKGEKTENWHIENGLCLAEATFNFFQNGPQKNRSGKSMLPHITL